MGVKRMLTYPPLHLLGNEDEIIKEKQLYGLFKKKNTAFKISEDSRPCYNPETDNIGHGICSLFYDNSSLIGKEIHGAAMEI
jgi:hypothetical protein